MGSFVFVSPSDFLRVEFASDLSSPAQSIYHRYELSLACIRNIVAIVFCSCCFFFLIYLNIHVI